MAKLTEIDRWEEEIYRIEENDPVHGGENGITNKPIKQLANRTRFLRQQLLLAGQKLVPKKLTSTTRNLADETGHTHEIERGDTTKAGLMQLTNDTGLDSENLGLSAKGGKAIAQSVAQLQQRVNDGLNQKVNKTDISDAVNSESRTSVASSKAVKIAYEKGVEAKEDAKQVLAELRNLQIGARNLIKNSRLLNGTQHWTTVGRQSTHNGVAVFGSLDRTQQWYWRQAFSLPESEYTFSALVKPEGTTYYLHVNNGTRWADYYARGLTPGVWQPVSILIRSAISMITFANPDALAEFSSPMLVEGNRATSWTPAPEDAEDYNRQNYVAKSGDTMTGNLILDNATSLLKGRQNGQDDWFVGRVRSGDNEIALASYKTGTSINLKANRIDFSKPLYQGNHLVFDENNLTPVRSVDLRSSIPNATVTYQNATPAQLPMGGYVGITTNSRLAGTGTYTGIGQFIKSVGAESYRFGANNGRFFSQTGNSEGWHRVCEHMMVRPDLIEENLNNVTDYGIYAQKLNERSALERNYPEAQAGVLLVSPSAYNVQQEYTTHQSNNKYVRNRKNNGWGEWRRIDAQGSVKKSGDSMDSLNINAGHKITTRHYGHGAWSNQYNTDAPYLVEAGNDIHRDVYHPFIKGRMRSKNAHGASFSFGWTSAQGNGDGFGRGTVLFCGDNGDIYPEQVRLWFFGPNGDFVAHDGDIKTGSGKSLNQALMRGEVAVLTGEIWHGGVIPLPHGFAEHECRWIVTPKMIRDDVSPSDINYFECHAIGTRVVTCLVEGRVSASSRAYYQIIGVKQ